MAQAGASVSLLAMARLRLAGVYLSPPVNRRRAAVLVVESRSLLGTAQARARVLEVGSRLQVGVPRMVRAVGAVGR